MTKVDPRELVQRNGQFYVGTLEADLPTNDIRYDRFMDRWPPGWRAIGGDFECIRSVDYTFDSQPWEASLTVELGLQRSSQRFMLGFEDAHENFRFVGICNQIEFKTVRFIPTVVSSDPQPSVQRAWNMWAVDPL